MLVKSIQGAQCPKENNPRDYITDTEPVEVPDTTYYRRLVTEGSLIEVPAEAETTDKKGGKK